jgi:hypothetical protein
MLNRNREVVMTLKGEIGRFLKLVLPGVVDNMAISSMKYPAS